MSCIAPGCGAPRELGALFCDKHLAAPTGKRGGWISAWKRSQRRGGGITPLDASAVARRLWVGSVPPFDRDLPDFDTLFLCAAEIQPPQLAFGREVVRVPLPDGALTSNQVRQALIGARTAARSLAGGKRVLVTCHMGRNRSALVACLALGMITRATPAALVQLIRDRRHPDALSNPHFVELIQRVAVRRR